MTLVRIPNQSEKSEEPGAAVELRPEVKDRVAEAYFGKLGPELRRATHKRLHWICEQVQGQTVLDIGCSQAITAILLAREGLSVTAIDIDPRTITDAQSIITTEPQHVMRNISLVNDDFLTHDFGPQRFETVLLAEVLEHLVNPARFVERAYNLTVPNGRAVLTVPFGINDWLDHKHTFYLLEPYRLVSRYFEVTECVLLDRWIGFIGARRASPVDQDKVLSLGLETVTLLEKGFFGVERVLRDQVAGLDESFRDATRQYSALREQASGYRSEAADAQAGLKRAEQGAQALKGEIAALEEKLRTRISENENAREILFEKTSAYKDSLHEAEKQQIRMEAELSALRGRLEEAAAKYQLALQKLKTLSLRLGKQAELSEDGIKALSEQKKRIAELEATLKAEREKHEAQLSDLSREDEKRELELAGTRKIAAQGEVRITELAAELASARQELEEEKAGYEERSAELTAALEEARREVSEGEEALGALRAEKALLEKRLTAEKGGHEAEKAGLTAKIAEQRGLLNDSAQRVDNIVASLEGLKTVYDRDTSALSEKLAQKAKELGVAEAGLKKTLAELEGAGREKAELALREEARRKELAVLTTRLAEAQAEADRKQQELAALRDEKGRVEDLLNEQAAQYKEALQKYKSKESEKESSLKNAWQKLTMLEGQITGFKAKLTEAQGALGALGAERDSLAAKLTAAEKENARAVGEARSLLSRLQSAEESLVEAQQSNMSLERQASERDALALKHQALGERLGARTAEVEELRSQLAQADKALAEAGEANKALLRAEGEREALEKAFWEREALALKFQALQTRMDNKTVELENLAAKLAKTERNLLHVQEAKRALAQAATERDALAEEVDALTTEIGDLRLIIEDERALHGDELDRLGRDQEASRVKFEEALAAERAESVAQIQAALTELTAASAELQRAEVERTTLAGNLELLRAAYDREGEAHRAKISDLDARLTRSEEKRVLAEERLVVLTEEIERLNDHIQRLDAAKIQAASLHVDQLVALERKLAEARQEHQTLLDESARTETRLAAELEARGAEVLDFDARLNRSEEKRALAEERLVALTEEIEGLNAHIQKLGAAQMQEASLHGAQVVGLEQKLSEAQTSRENIFHESVRAQAQASKVEQRLTGEIEAKDAQIAALLERLGEVEILRAKVEALEAVAEEVPKLTALRAEDQEALTKAKFALEEAFSQGEMQSAKLRDQENLLEKLKLQALRSKKQTNDLTRQVSQLNQGLLAAEHEVVKTKDTLSYQLGYKLIQGFKSFDKFVALPGELMRLRAEARRRREIKSAAHARTAMPQFTPRGEAAAPSVAPVITDLPRLGLGDVADLKSLKVACIMDEFTYTSYSPECNFLQLSPAHWRSELEAVKPDLLFIESAWRGKDSLWGAKIAQRSREVVEIVQWCNRQGIPTAFWNKEDPVHFETFLTTAKLFDHVFTTDIDCIGRYKAALDHDRVYLLPFAAQPDLCNPVETYERKNAFSFAGAYYLRYPDRARDFDNIVGALAEHRPVEIFDRNQGKEDPNYKFPPEYAPYIVGTLRFNEINQSYKGYRYGINLNSIKQSQSMFARRVFELLASNTITVSNYSRGMKLFFGDLVLVSDSGDDLWPEVSKLEIDDATHKKHRLAALRKVMGEHTYQDRLHYVVSKAKGQEIPSGLPGITVTSFAKNESQAQSILENYARQSYDRKNLLLIVPPGVQAPEIEGLEGVEIMAEGEAAQKNIGEVADENTWIAAFIPDDYYGPNYLTDMALATRYSKAHFITKTAHYLWSPSKGLSLQGDGTQYRPAAEGMARSAILRAVTVEQIKIKEWVSSLYLRTIETNSEDPENMGLSIDEFNYLRNGMSEKVSRDEIEKVDDLAGIDTGMPLAELIKLAEAIQPESNARDLGYTFTGRDLYTMLPAARGPNVTFGIRDSAMTVESSLAEGQVEYVFLNRVYKTAELGFTDTARVYMEATPGLNLSVTLYFNDKNDKRIGHEVKPVNRNNEVLLPEGTETIRVSVRVYGPGSASISSIVFGMRAFKPSMVIGRRNELLLTNNYPSVGDLYKNPFVHSRVLTYKENGNPVDVFRLRPDEPMAFHEFQGIDVISGSDEVLEELLNRKDYRTILVHFLDEKMWERIEPYAETKKIIVWIHGVEIQPWTRRSHLYTTDAQREEAKVKSQKRLAFWRRLIGHMPKGMKLVFVSQYLTDVVMEDLGMTIPADRYEIIHNPIDHELFDYQPKSRLQRKKILSIRPYANTNYANDLSVKAIMELSKAPFFGDLEFRMIGDGHLFEETLAPLADFNNVHIERRFLTQREIANIHKSYGIFLCPSRMDTQGISRDEAMASGLVPVTSGVAAIPEFVDDTCGILAPAEDHHALAEGIAELYEHPELFERMSLAAAERVRRQSDKHTVASAEMKLFLP